MIKFLLRDTNADIVQAWQTQFKGVEEVEASQGDIFDLRADAIVSPANSFGFMDGGIDLRYSKRFGWDLQDRLRAQLAKAHDGELPVGQALVIETFDAHIPYLVCAPTMRVPMDVSDTVNAYLAFRAAIRAVNAHNRSPQPRIQSVLCPGLGTAVGRPAPVTCAVQMHEAFCASYRNQPLIPMTLGQAKDEHFRLLR